MMPDNWLQSFHRNVDTDGKIPCPSPGDLPEPGIEPRSPALQTDSFLTVLRGKPRGRGGWDKLRK